MEALFAKAKKIIDNANNIVLSTHEDPDLDGLGSILALAHILQQMGKTVLIFSQSPLPGALKSQSQHKIVNDLNPEDIDLLIGLDYGSPERLEVLRTYPEIKADILTFDHHAIGRHLGLKIVDPKTSSTAEIIYNFINFLNAPINTETAVYLLTGIMNDTGNFRHINTSANTLKITGELMLKGASLQKISQANNSLNLINEKSLALTEIFKRIKTAAKGNLVFVIIDHELFNNFYLRLTGIDVTSILSAAPEIKVAAILAEKTLGLFDVSLRSQQDKGVDVAKIARQFGGGGHRLAAGFRSSDAPEEIIAQIEQLLLATAE